jgi:hypothetical protein
MTMANELSTALDADEPAGWLSQKKINITAI